MTKTCLAALAALVLVSGIATAESLPVLDHAKVFKLAEAPARAFANGGGARDLILGTLKTGEAVKLHESMQPEGAEPNPAHAIDHSEFIIVGEGTLEFIHDGITETAGPGDVLYVAQGTMHQVRNAGTGKVKYAIVSIGGDIKPK
jgi:quercetin dioxygenase-like cupin family protein